MEEFFIDLALCHTVQVSVPSSGKQEQKANIKPSYVNDNFNPDPFDYVYQASSPDEKALVEACRRYAVKDACALLSNLCNFFLKRRLGIIFHGEEDDLMRLTVFGEDRNYRRLQVLEFDSDRKRMSTIVLFPDDSIWLLCKGAESAVVPRCTNGPIEETLDHINDYALVQDVWLL